MKAPQIGSIVKLDGYPDDYEVVALGCVTSMSDWADLGQWCPNGEAAITLRSISRPYECTLCFSVMQITHIDGESVANLISSAADHD